MASLTTLGAAIVGGNVGGVAGGLSAALAGGSLGDVLRGAVVGAMQGVITAGVLHGWSPDVAGNQAGFNGLQPSTSWAMESLRRGWHLGEVGFKEKLLALLDKTADRLRGKKNHAGDAVRAHHQVEAERIVSFLAEELGLPTSTEELEHRKKSDPRKVVCAA